MPIKRHPDFRIFSCMNPNTDVDKKDSPVGVRNRFTEFFVDELVSDNGLLILMGDYLSSTGIQKSGRETLYAIEECVAAGIGGSRKV
jgi:midasin